MVGATELEPVTFGSRTRRYRDVKKRLQSILRLCLATGWHVKVQPTGGASVERDLATMFRDYDSARVTVKQYKAEMLPRAQQAYKLYQTSYQKMAAAYPQVLIAQRTLFQLEADYIQALENAWQSSLVIRGFGLMEGLSAPINPSMSGGQPGSAGLGAYNSRPTSVQ